MYPQKKEVASQKVLKVKMHIDHLSRRNYKGTSVLPYIFNFNDQVYHNFNVLFFIKIIDPYILRAHIVAVSDGW